MKGTTDQSDAFNKSGQPASELYAEALRIHSTFRIAGGWFGAWVGLVIGIKLIYLAIRRRRIGYQLDRASCVSCGRCFAYCPGQHTQGFEI
jgi:NosR/NirI family transcriptional regulator, nitrous oxide reductase regulator